MILLKLVLTNLVSFPDVRNPRSKSDVFDLHWSIDICGLRLCTYLDCHTTHLGHCQCVIVWCILSLRSHTFVCGGCSYCSCGCYQIHFHTKVSFTIKYLDFRLVSIGLVWVSFKPFLYNGVYFWNKKISLLSAQSGIL